MNQLLEFLEYELEHVTDQTMCVVKNVLRKYPERAGDVSVVVNKCMNQAASPEGRSAVIWIYGMLHKLIVFEWISIFHCSEPHAPPPPPRCFNQMFFSVATGEFGSLISEAPYQLEKIIDTLDTEVSIFFWFTFFFF